MAPRLAPGDERHEPPLPAFRAGQVEPAIARLLARLGGAFADLLAAPALVGLGVDLDDRQVLPDGQYAQGARRLGVRALVQAFPHGRVAEGPLAFFQRESDHFGPLGEGVKDEARDQVDAQRNHLGRRQCHDARTAFRRGVRDGELGLVELGGVAGDSEYVPVERPVRSQGHVDHQLDTLSVKHADPRKQSQPRAFVMPDLLPQGQKSPPPPGTLRKRSRAGSRSSPRATRPARPMPL